MITPLNDKHDTYVRLTYHTVEIAAILWISSNVTVD